MTEGEQSVVTGRVWDLDAKLLIAPAEPPDVPADSEGLGRVLDGDDLPSPGLRVRIVGAVMGPVVRVHRWAEVPDSAWAWSTSSSVGSAAGTDQETSDRIGSPPASLRNGYVQLAALEPRAGSGS